MPELFPKVFSVLLVIIGIFFVIFAIIATPKRRDEIWWRESTLAKVVLVLTLWGNRSRETLVFILWILGLFYVILGSTWILLGIPDL